MNAAIVDNTVLANFLDTNNHELLDKAQSIFSIFYIPETIYNEFLAVKPPYLAPRLQFADRRIRLERGFYRLCTTFDPIVLGALTTMEGVHSGEAQAIAQAKQRGVNIILTDDKRCRRFIADRYPHLRCYSTQFLIAMLDLSKLLDPDNTWANLCRHHQFKSKDIREAYQQAYAYLGIAADKKHINRRCKATQI